MKQEEIKELIETFAASGLTAFRYDTESESLSLKKTLPTPQIAVPMEAIPAQPSANVPAAQPAAAAAPKEANAQPVESGTVVKAPLAGVFYRAEKPDAEPYVRVGTAVKKGQTLGLIEAMKLMSEIAAPCDGVVESIPVDNGAFAEYGTTLFVIGEQHV